MRKLTIKNPVVGGLVAGAWCLAAHAVESDWEQNPLDHGQPITAKVAMVEGGFEELRTESVSYSDSKIVLPAKVVGGSAVYLIEFN